MNEIRKVLPPGFNERAMDAANPSTFALNIPLMYSNKNPYWQQLTINEPDFLEPDVVMPRLNQNELFAPETEDVALLEREVNIYRSRAADPELEALRNQRRILSEQMHEVPSDDIEEQLRMLESKIRMREREIGETSAMTHAIEEENRRLEAELSRVHVVAPSPPIPVVVRSPPQRSRSPGINILPSHIDQLPDPARDRQAFNYRPNDNPAFLSGNLSDPEFRHQAHLPDSHPMPLPVITSTPQTSPPVPHRISYTSQAPVVQSPAIRPSPVTEYRPAVTSTVINPTGVRISNTSATRGMPVSTGGAVTYKINGVTYTDATLPANYAHLRRA